MNTLLVGMTAVVVVVGKLFSAVIKSIQGSVIGNEFGVSSLVTGVGGIRAQESVHEVSWSP